FELYFVWKFDDWLAGLGVSCQRKACDERERDTSLINPHYILRLAAVKKEIPARSSYAASGHAAAPPSNVMNWRRVLIRSPRRQSRLMSTAARGRAPSLS